jgi:hypothetical protein
MAGSNASPPRGGYVGSAQGPKFDSLPGVAAPGRPVQLKMKFNFTFGVESTTGRLGLSSPSSEA